MQAQPAAPGGKENKFTLITFQDHFRPTKGKGVKVIFADLDHTLITPKGKHVFPKTLDDWKWKNEAVVPKLKEMYNMGYEIVIATNNVNFLNTLLSSVLECIFYLTYICYILTS